MPTTFLLVFSTVFMGSTLKNVNDGTRWMFFPAGWCAASFFTPVMDVCCVVGLLLGKFQVNS